ncbi:acetylornithine aminotransferase [Pseudoglutamicibacter albus]|uniref:Acetylornithine aminotransferase n=1 Tax=Pseudoglutamicibacter albus TaxID=98671 RepID=A0ABU1YY06_9MICC|nr:acetylornithine aminotransferase [Pseudoglutamicibacter albus]
MSIEDYDAVAQSALALAQEASGSHSAASETGETNESLLGRYKESLMGVFGTPQRPLVRGRGSYVWDADGNQYLDLLAGIAVNALGHGHPDVVRAVSEQISTLGHVSNFFTSPTQVALAEKILKLAQASSGSAVFFTNSGTESNEAAFKLARRNAGTDEKPRTRIVALKQGFHGRTMGALSMTWKPAYRAPFEPLVPGVEWIEPGDVDALTEAVDETVQAVIVEPIQGEAGVRELPEGYLEEVRRLTREHGALMIVDEVQTGIARTGEWFASLSRVTPDAMTLAKGLGGGMPLGALVTFGEENSKRLSAGQHGTTFGGNPVATAAGLAVLQALESEGIVGHVKETGAWLAEQLAQLPEVESVHGKGLLLGVEVGEGIAPHMVRVGLDAGFIINATGPSTVRLAPPLNISRDELQTFLEAFPQIHAEAQFHAEAAKAREQEGTGEDDTQKEGQQA